MALPSYDKSKRRRTYEQLPKDAYVLKILGAKEEKSKNSDSSYISIAFDIAEGEYAGFYDKQFQANTSEDKKWPNDAIFRITIPTDESKDFIWTNYNSFFADLEDSNSGFVFGGDLKTLRGKFIGGKFHIEQNEYEGTVYDHTRMKWSCVADDVRQGKAGKLPNDKLIDAGKGRHAAAPSPTSSDGWMAVRRVTIRNFRSDCLWTGWTFRTR